MKKKILLLILLNLYLTQLSSQNTGLDDLVNKVDDYFHLDYETFYTQLNKTTYFKNEEIWFKTYVYNTKTQLPFISSTNIYNDLYDENGKLIIKKIYAANSGMTNGNIKIDSTFKTGTYYLKTHTNWSENFSLNNNYVQKIEIINKVEKIQKKESIKTSYDFQLLPEGGHIISNITNTVGFKIVNSLGKSVKTSSGVVIDSNNKIITSFKSNPFGIGKFVFKPQKDVDYFCKATLENGEIITKKIAEITNKGIGLNIITNELENTIININTNENTLASLTNKSYSIIIHRDGIIKETEVSFIKNKLNYSYKINNSLLHSGINIITLLNEKNAPVSERIIFNHYKSPIKTIGIQQIIKGKDSSIIKLKTSGENIKNINLSISVLPSQTKANSISSNIISSFLITPYIKGTIKNPNYYFNEINREKKNNLDLLLLTQGWSKYDWGDVFNNPPKISHNFETGFIIKGKINSSKFKPNDKIILQSKENGFLQESLITEEGNFNFKELFIAEDSKLNFSLKTKKGKYKNPKIYYNIYPTYVNSSLHFIKKNRSNTLILDKNLESFAIDKSAIILDEIKIKSHIKSKPINKPRGGSMMAKYISFNKEKNEGALITDKLRPYFNVTNIGGNVTITSRRYTSLYFKSAPRVFLDNVDISDSLDIISDLRVFETEEMFVTKGLSAIYNATGIIHLFTKRGLSKPNANKYTDAKVPFGFSIPKEYYNPIYNELNYDNFRSYGTLNWIPNLITDKNGELSFKISNKFDGPVNLYIEGMSKDGFLFSRTETIYSTENL